MAEEQQQERREQERRQKTGAQRSARVVVGTSSMPVALIIAWAYAEIWGKQMDVNVAIALATVIGSFTTTVALCFQDMRAIWLARYLKRRGTDRRPRK